MDRGAGCSKGVLSGLPGNSCTEQNGASRSGAAARGLGPGVMRAVVRRARKSLRVIGSPVIDGMFAKF